MKNFRDLIGQFECEFFNIICICYFYFLFIWLRYKKMEGLVIILTGGVFFIS